MILTTLAAGAALQSAPALEIENYVGEIRIIEGERLSARLVRPGDGAQPQTELAGDVLSVDGGVQVGRWRCRNRWGGELRLGPRRGQLRALEDFPLLEITAPAGTALDLKRSLVFATAGALGPVDVSLSSCGEVDIASVDGDAELAVAGGADLSLGDVTGAVSVSLSGSGDVDVGRAASLDARVSGSGDVQTGDVAGPVELRLSGSGDVSLGDVARLTLNASGSAEVEIADAPGGISASISGSGELEFAEAGGLDATISGSGDIYGARVDGAFAAGVSGSGDIHVEAGRAEPFDVRIGGSGDIRFGGTAVNPRARINGGSVRLGAVEGEVDVNRNGAQDLRVGG